MTHCGYDIIKRRQLNGNYRDRHLMVVLGDNENGGYVTWVYDTTNKTYSGGHYFRDKKEAYDDYRVRGLLS